MDELQRVRHFLRVQERGWVAIIGILKLSTLWDEPQRVRHFLRVQEREWVAIIGIPKLSTLWTILRKAMWPLWVCMDLGVRWHCMGSHSVMSASFSDTSDTS